MTARRAVLGLLHSAPWFRERKNKDKGIVTLLLERYPGLVYAINEGYTSRDSLEALVGDYNSMDRQWRKCLEENPELRGGDYDQKDRLEAERMAKLGYNPPSAVGEGNAALPLHDVECTAPRDGICQCRKLNL